MDLKNILPSKILEVIDRAEIATSKQIMILSVWDIKKLTNLRTDDIVLMKNLIADQISPLSVTCNKLLQGNQRIATGCKGIDKMLRGGFKLGTITEVYGKSGCGKTQIALQAAAHNWSSGTVFICTEDLFPVKRFEQVKRSIAGFNSYTDYGKNIFVEHITEANDLLSCIRVRLPHLLRKITASLIVVDSVAGPFRSEYTNYVQRAEELRELAIELIKVSQVHNTAVLCINQVTASFAGTGTDNILPSLGLAWSNIISTRLWLRKTNESFHLKNIPASSHSKTLCQEEITYIRELSVVFAADLPNSTTKFLITQNGIQSINYNP